MRDLAAVLGGLLIAVGTGLIFLPAALIVAGSLVIGGLWLETRARLRETGE